MQPNTLLDAILDEAGISHAGLAAHVNQAGRARGLALRYEHTAVARWLKGQRPRGQVPDLICEVLAGRLHRPVTLDDIGLGVPGEPSTPHGTSLSGFVERATALWRSDEQQRPHILGAPAVTGTPAVMPVWEWENPPEDVDVSRGGRHRVTTADIEMLRAARTHYEQMYRKAGGIATRTRIVGFLNAEAAPLLRGSYTDATGRQLHRATGGLVAIAGICAYDSDAHGLAQRYFHQALGSPKPAATGDSAAYVIALLVNQSLFMREYRQAVAFAEAALRAAGRTSPRRSPPTSTRCRPRRTPTSATAERAVLHPAGRAGRRTYPAGLRARRDRLCPAGPGQRPGGGGTAQPRRPGGGGGARGGRRRQPGARPGPGAPARHAQPRSNCARATPTKRWPRPSRWRSRPGEWSPSGCATDSARYANTWCAAAARARPRPPNSSTAHCAYRCRERSGKPLHRPRRSAGHERRLNAGHRFVRPCSGAAVLRPTQ